MLLHTQEAEGRQTCAVTQLTTSPHHSAHNTIRMWDMTAWHQYNLYGFHDGPILPLCILPPSSSRSHSNEVYLILDSTGGDVNPPSGG